MTQNGKRPVVFNIREGYADMPVTVPCGRCIGCRLEKSRQWAIRCMHEASLHTDNCFLTLTYNDNNLPADGSIHLEHFQKFLKRLRKHYADKTIRYYHCGEYGDRFNRPHYHAILFGFDPPDKELLRTDQNGFRLYTSQSLAKIWPFGYHTVGAVTFETAAYVARYVTKKLTGTKPFDVKINGEIKHYENALEHYQIINYDTGEINYRNPEYATMSLKPGIAAGWIEKYQDEVYPADRVIVRGREVKPPRFYDTQFEYHDPEGFRKLKNKRISQAKKNDLARLEVMEICKLSQIKNLKRHYEDSTIFT